MIKGRKLLGKNTVIEMVCCPPNPAFALGVALSGLFLIAIVLIIIEAIVSAIIRFAQSHPMITGIAVVLIILLVVLCKHE